MIELQIALVLPAYVSTSLLVCHCLIEHLITWADWYVNQVCNMTWEFVEPKGHARDMLPLHLAVDNILGLSGMLVGRIALSVLGCKVTENW